MKVIYILFIFCAPLIFMGCLNKKSKKHYLNTRKVCNNLYVQYYKVYNGGAIGGELISDFLTDSSNFRKYIGTFDSDDEYFVYTCENGNVSIEKKTKGKNGNAQILERKLLNLNSLKEKHILE